jgi:hypothetical protein
MNLYKINTSAFEEEDFLLVTDLTKSRISEVIKPMVKKERKTGTIHSNEEYVWKLKETYPNNIIVMYESPDQLNF